jgi:large repetitive protein
MLHLPGFKQAFLLLALSFAALCAPLEQAAAADISFTFQVGVENRQIAWLPNPGYDFVSTGPAVRGSVPGLSAVSFSLYAGFSGTPTTAGTYTGEVWHDYRYYTNEWGEDSWEWRTNVWTWEVTVLPAPPAVRNLNVTVEANSSDNAIDPGVDSEATLSVASQPSHGSVTVEGGVFRYTPTADYSGSDSFTYAATKDASTSAAATVSITVNPPPPYAGTFDTTVPENSTDNQIQIVASNSPTGGSIINPPENGTATMSGLTISYTPTLGFHGSDSIGYVAYNDYGGSNVATIRITVTKTAPTATDQTVSVAANSTDNAVTLSTTGIVDSSEIISDPSHGTASLSGTTLTYTPSSGYSGTDSLTYRVTNDGGSADATVTITVTAPTLTITPSTLSEAQVGSSYSETLSASLGTAPYTFTASGLPGGLTLSDDGTLSGIPEEAGDFTVTVTATDTLGAIGQADLSLTVLPEDPVAGDVSASVAEGTSDNAITLSLSGGAAESVAVASAPSHGTATASGTAILYTPASGYIGTDSFTYTATNAAGTSDPAAVSITVTSTAATITFTPNGGALDEAMAGEDYSASISATGGTGDLTYSLTSGSLPEGLTLNVTTGALNGPLSEDATVGNYAFTLTATDSRGETGSAAFTLSVIERAVTIADTTVTVAEGGSPPDLYLNNKATGGPFTDADVVGVEPANAGTAEIVSGELASTSSSTPVGYYLRFTPSVYFTGNARVVYKLSSAIGVANGTVTYALTADDQQVANAVDSAVRDFVSTRQSLLTNQIHAPNLKDRRRMAEAPEPVTVTANGTDATGAASFGFATSLAAVESARRIAAGEDSAAAGLGNDFNLWLDGSVSLYRDDGTGDWGTFGLLNLGADYLVSDHLLIGLSLHVDRMTDPTDEDEQLTGLGWLAGPYASMEIARDIFLDTSLRYGGSANDIEAGDWTGDFDTARWMADMALSGEWQIAPDTVLTPAMRIVYFDEKVETYEISDGAGSILGIDGFNERQLRANLGLDLSHEMELSNGLTLSPSAGVKLGYAALDGNGLFGSVSTGIAVSDGSGWNLDAKLLYSVESGGSQSLGADLGLRVRF